MESSGTGNTKIIYFLIVIPNADFSNRTPTRKYAFSTLSIPTSIIRSDIAQSEPTLVKM